ncbi:MAG: S8 family serine peptidase [Nanoarchaeota archaeon]
MRSDDAGGGSLDEQLERLEALGCRIDREFSFDDGLGPIARSHLRDRLADYRDRLGRLRQESYDPIVEFDDAVGLLDRYGVLSKEIVDTLRRASDSGDESLRSGFDALRDDAARIRRGVSQLRHEVATVYHVELERMANRRVSLNPFKRLDVEERMEAHRRAHTMLSERLDVIEGVIAGYHDISFPPYVQDAPDDSPRVVTRPRRTVDEVVRDRYESHRASHLRSVGTADIIIPLCKDALSCDAPARFEELVHRLKGKCQDVLSVSRFSYVPFASMRVPANEEENIVRVFSSRSMRTFLDGIGVHVQGKLARSNIYVIPELLSDPLPVRSSAAGYIHPPLWSQRSIRSVEANEVARGTGVRIGIIDTGCDYHHPAISGAFDPADPGWDVRRGNGQPMDRDGHGTHVAGTAAARAFGVAPEASLVAVRVLENGSGSDTDIMNGIEYCIKHDIRVMNMSLGGPGSSVAFAQLCDHAYRSGFFMFASAGNDGSCEYPNYPAAYQGVFAVGAYDQSEVRASFSTGGDYVVCVMPGVDIESSVPGGVYDSMSGTSMAAPHATGVGALALSIERSLKPEYLRSLINAGTLTEVIGDGDPIWYGYGKLRADKVVEHVG